MTHDLANPPVLAFLIQLPTDEESSQNKGYAPSSTMRDKGQNGGHERQDGHGRKYPRCYLQAPREVDEQLCLMLGGATRNLAAERGGGAVARALSSGHLVLGQLGTKLFV